MGRGIVVVLVKIAITQRCTYVTAVPAARHRVVPFRVVAHAWRVRGGRSIPSGHQHHHHHCHHHRTATSGTTNAARKADGDHDGFSSRWHSPAAARNLVSILSEAALATGACRERGDTIHTQQQQLRRRCTAPHQRGIRKEACTHRRQSKSRAPRRSRCTPWHSRRLCSCLEPRSCCWTR